MISCFGTDANVWTTTGVAWICPGAQAGGIKLKACSSFILPGGLIQFPKTVPSHPISFQLAATFLV